MKIDEWSDLLCVYVPAAAFGAAVELGLFWDLAEEPQSAEQMAVRLDIPPRRCRIWLELLVGLQLLDRQGARYAVSGRARADILETHSRESWQLMAQEARERDLAGHNLALHVGYPGSVWEAQGHATPDYVAQMMEDPERARRFTQMNHELSRPLADELAQVLDIGTARRLLDVGGGSGVIALALLRRYPNLTATVVDLEPVCTAGREIADGLSEGHRLSFHPADFLQDDLPVGYDAVIACRVGVYGAGVYQKVARSLTPGGRLIVVDKLVREGIGTPWSGLVFAFLSSLQDPDFYLISIDEVTDRLTEAGFQVLSIQALTTGETVIETQLQP